MGDMGTRDPASPTQGLRGLCARLREARCPLYFLLPWPPHHSASPHCVLNVQHFYSRPESTGQPLAQDVLWTPALRVGGSQGGSTSKGTRDGLWGRVS